MTNKLLALVMALFAMSSVNAQQFVGGVFGSSGDGTTSATAFVPKGAGPANVTDLSYNLDQGTSTGTVDIRMGEQETAITSATSGTGSVLWFDNNPNIVTLGEYVIFYDDSAGSYFLYRCTVVASAGTSITVQETAPITTTSDKLYSCLPTVRRHAHNPRSNTTGRADIWLPSDLPSALTIDGNTTSCRISVNGARLKN